MTTPPHAPLPRTNIWRCKIGEIDKDTHAMRVPPGGDSPMRAAVAEAYRKLTGEEPTFIFSGWGSELTEPERAVVENRASRRALVPAAPAVTPARALSSEEDLTLVADHLGGKTGRMAGAVERILADARAYRAALSAVPPARGGAVTEEMIEAVAKALCTVMVGQEHDDTTEWYPWDHHELDRPDTKGMTGREEYRILARAALAVSAPQENHP